MNWILESGGWAESYGTFSIILFMVDLKVTQGLSWLVIIEEANNDRVFIAQYYAKCFTYNMSNNPHNSPIKKGLLLFPF